MPSAVLANFRSPAAICRFFLTCALGVALDIWSKAVAFAHLQTGEIFERGHQQPLSKTYVVIDGWLQFRLTDNYGAVFGLGQGYRWLFVIISLAAISFLTYLFANSGRNRFYQFVLGLLLAGVLGNMYDRLLYGYVRDFIHMLPRYASLFPYIFNVADVMLCCGVGLIFVQFLFGVRPKDGEQLATTNPSESPLKTS